MRLGQVAGAQDRTRDQFGRTSRAYVDSADHREGSDLDRLLELLDPGVGMRVLDVGTGAGHTAAAIAARGADVLAVDVTPEMVERTLERARAHDLPTLHAQVMDVHALDLPDGVFDAVTSRIAAHHFTDIGTALREMRRVLRRGGKLLIVDSCSPGDPELDRFLDGLERTRDATHVRSYTRRQWVELVSGAELELVHDELHRRRHDVDAWIARAGASAEVARCVHEIFRTAPAAALEHFAIELEQGRAVRYTDDKILVVAVRP